MANALQSRDVPIPKFNPIPIPQNWANTDTTTTDTLRSMELGHYLGTKYHEP